MSETQTSEKRAVEPNVVSVTSPGRMPKRIALAEKFSTENPGYVHLWMDQNTPQGELEMLGYERAKWPDRKEVGEALRGKDVRLRQDVLVRVKKDVFDASRKEGEDRSRALVDQSMRGKDKDEDLKWQPRAVTRKPKDARDIGKPVN